MAFINITTNDGELVERINTSEYDLSKPLARQALTIEVLEALQVADTQEA